MKKKPQPKPIVTRKSQTLSTPNHSKFFDNLINQIPPRFNPPTTDDDNIKRYFQGLSKSAKLASLQNTKIAKCARLLNDPNDPVNLKFGNGEKGDAKKKMKMIESGTYEEVRERHKFKMSQFRSDGSERNRDMQRQKPVCTPKHHDNKRKRGEANEGRKPLGNGNGVNRSSIPTTGAVSVKTVEDVEKAAEELTFGYMRIGDEEERMKKKRKKFSKVQVLEQAKKLEELKKVDPEVAKKAALKKAIERAQGIKVHDDPSKMKKSIKKDKKMKQQSAVKWKDRIESRQKERAEKENKRKGNILERAKQKKDRKIAKREKKLMKPGRGSK